MNSINVILFINLDLQIIFQINIQGLYRKIDLVKSETRSTKFVKEPLTLFKVPKPTKNLKFNVDSNFQMFSFNIFFLK